MRFLLLSLFSALLLTPLPAQTAMPAEVKKEILTFMATMNQAALTCKAEVASVDSAPAMAAALNRYIGAIEPATQRMQAVRQTYRSFFDAAEQEPGKGLDDPELEKASKTLEATMTGMAATMAKAAQWLGHPQVKQALDRLENLMGGLDGADADAGDEDGE